MPTKNPKPWEYDDSLPEPDESTWQVVKFTVERKDGGVVDAELLRPRSWVEANGLDVGRLLPIDIEELQIEGSATVTAIESAPAIPGGEGSAVTGRFITRRVDEL